MNLSEFLEFIKNEQQIEVCWLNEKGGYSGDQIIGLCKEVRTRIPNHIAGKRVDECFLLLKCAYDGHLIIAERMRYKK
ncbi:hypothetical protein EDD63_11634 [Breznakia blatticola]|uniref:Uncharacterized protein n=1 Tax=Breznakia blatticola TaxID=1754012 RepID=A0A4R7ZQF9_9FIRM|nr:hypothetical protein [Breznakia blatticola]TDW19932.1 hypothetical protein EDD63_11634 [Breznakia blatticola]